VERRRLITALRNPSAFPVLNQFSRVQAPLSNFLKIHFYFILPSTPRSTKWALSLRPPHKNHVCTSPVYHTCHMPRPLYSSWFDHSLLHSLSLFPFRAKYLPQQHIFKALEPMFLPQCERPIFTPIQTTDKTAVLYILIFIFLDSRLKDKQNLLHHIITIISWLRSALISSWLEFLWVRVVSKYL